MLQNIFDGWLHSSVKIKIVILLEEISIKKGKMEIFSEAVKSNKIAKLKEFILTKCCCHRRDYLDGLVRHVSDSKLLYELFNSCGEEVNDFFKMNQQYLFDLAIKAGKDKNIVQEIVNLDKDFINNNDALAEAVSRNEDISFIQFLLNNNADVNRCNKKGETPLHFADRSEIVKLLIENGADVNQADVEGETPIMSALVRRRDKEVILEFIKNGADLNVRNKDGQTSLHLALCCKYDEDIINQIWSKTNDVNVKDNKGLTPLCYALPNYQKGFIYELINKGFVVDFKVFLYAVSHCRDVDLIKSLAQYVDIKCVDKEGNCVLYHVRDARLIGWFVRRGVSIYHKNNDGRTPLMTAIIQDKLKVVESLLYWGSGIKNLDELCHLVQERDSYSLGSIYDLLVLYGMNVNLKNRLARVFLSRWLDCIAIGGMERYMYMRGLLGHIFLSNGNVVVPDYLMIEPTINEFIKTYRSEINKLKDVVFVDRISYFDFCLKQYRLVRSKYVDEGVTDADCEKIKELFAMLYKEVIVKIEMNIKIHKRKASIRKLMNVNLTSKRREIGNNSDCDSDSICDKVHLDCDCMYLLGSFLNDREINCLIAAAIID